MVFLGRRAWSLDLLGVDQVGCNLNPEIGMPALERSDYPIKALIAGGGPAGMSAALCMSKHVYQVTFVEKTDHRGGQIALSWQAPGKGAMKEGSAGFIGGVTEGVALVILNRAVDAALVREAQPDLPVWGSGG